MYKLSDAYDAENGPTVATIVLSVGISVIFIAASFLFLNAHSNSLAKKLQHTTGDLSNLANKKDVTYDNLNLNNNLSVSGTTSLKGDVSTDSDLSVGGKVDITSDLTVGTNTDLKTLLDVQGDTNLGGTLNVLGKTNLAGNLDVTADTTLQSDISVGGDTSFGGNLVLNQGANFRGNLDVTGTSNLKSTLGVGGDTSLDGSQTSPDGSRFLGVALTLQGAANFTGNLDVSGVTVLQSTLTVSGNDSTASFDASQTAPGGNSLLAPIGFQVAGAANFSSTGSNNLDVTGTTRLNSILSLQGGEINTSLDGTWTQTTTGTANTGVTSLLSNSSTLIVAGASTFGTSGTANSSTNANGTTTSGTTNTTGTTSNNLDITGTTQLSNILSLQGGEINTSLDGTWTQTTAGSPNIGVSSLLSAAPTLSVTGASAFGTNGTTNTTVTTNGPSTVTNTVTSGTNSNNLDITGTALIDDIFDVQGNEINFSLDGIWTQTTAGSPNIGVSSLLNNATTLTVTGNTSVVSTGANSFDVTGTAQLGGTLVVQGGETSFSIDTSALGPGVTALTVGNTSISSTGETSFDVTGAATINGALTVSGASSGTTFDDTLTVNNGPVSLVGDFNVAGAVFVNTTLNVTGVTTFDDNLTVNHAVVNGNVVANTGNLTLNDGYIDALGNIATHGVFSVHSSYAPADYHSGVTFDALDTTANGGPGGPHCQKNVKHIRILEITGGIITNAECATDGVGGSSTYDLAENFPSTQSLTAGDVVAIDTTNSENVVRSTGTTSKLVIGVVSTAPGITLGQNGPGYPIALSGRVPVKVTNEAGSIAAGDYLTSSSTPGYAKKAAPGDKTIGQAMASFDGTSGTVVVFVNNSGGNVAPQELVQGTQSPTQTGIGNFTDLNVSGLATMNDLKVTGMATVKDLKVEGTATVVTLQINGHIIGNDDTRGLVTVLKGSKTVHHDFASPYDKAPAVVASPVTQAVLYSLTPTPTGFDVNLATAATTNVDFNYLVQQ